MDYLFSKARELVNKSPVGSETQKPQSKVSSGDSASDTSMSVVSSTESDVDSLFGDGGSSKRPLESGPLTEKKKKKRKRAIVRPVDPADKEGEIENDAQEMGDDEHVDSTPIDEEMSVSDVVIAVSEAETATENKNVGTNEAKTEPKVAQRQKATRKKRQVLPKTEPKRYANKKRFVGNDVLTATHDFTEPLVKRLFQKGGIKTHATDARILGSCLMQSITHALAEKAAVLVASRGRKTITQRDIKKASKLILKKKLFL